MSADLTLIRDRVWTILQAIDPTISVSPLPASAAQVNQINVASDQQRLYQIAAGILSNVYPLHAHQDADLTGGEGVYRLAGEGETEWNGVPLSQVSALEIAIRASTNKEMSEHIDALALALQTEAGMQVTDTASDYDNLRKAYRTDMAIEVCTPLADVQVLEIGATAMDAEYVNCGEDLRTQFMVIFHHPLITALHTWRDAVRCQLTDDWEPAGRTGIEFLSGDILPAAGGLSGWADLYQWDSALEC